VCHSVLQCVADCCSGLGQRTHVPLSLLHSGLCCSVSQCVAMCCRLLQWVRPKNSRAVVMFALRSLLQCVAECCSVLGKNSCTIVILALRPLLQCVAVCCNVLHYTETLWNTPQHTATNDMGWLRLVGSLKVQVSFAEYSFFHRDLLQKRPEILRSLLIVATP